MDLSLLLTILFFAEHVHSETTEEWMYLAKKELYKALDRQDNTNVAKNVVLFLGDGMGVSTVTAARIYKGQVEGQTGEETLLYFENFPNVALSKTYNNDRQTPDSAATSTAFLCGTKSNMGTLGVNSNVIRGNCSSSKGQEVTSILDWSLAEGKSVGIVTTARVTHATPAAGYAHSPERDWELDTKITDPSGGCKDIALQLIEKRDIQVILGGGRASFMLSNQTDPETKAAGHHRQDQRDLIKEWKYDKESTGKRAAYVWKTKQFDAVNPSETDFLLGLFEGSHMQYEADRDKSADGEPSIADMTKKAIQILEKNEKGYFLLVEGGRIDHAHHDNNANRALQDTVAFHEAVRAASDVTNERDTLTVVTADHSHVFNIGGYPRRGNNILGKVEPVSFLSAPIDGLPHTTLVYGNGPAGQARVDITNVDTTQVDYQQEAAINMMFETHGGEDVAIYAKGPMAHLFHGVHEQHYIAHVMSYASCVGPYKEKCDRPETASGSRTVHVYTWSLFLALIVCFVV